MKKYFTGLLLALLSLNLACQNASLTDTDTTAEESASLDTSQDSSTNQDVLEENNEQQEAALPPQPFVFENVGPYLQGNLIHLHQLPSGKWLVASLQGTVYLLTENFSWGTQQHLPVLAFHDMGLIDFEVQDGFVYLYHGYISYEDGCSPQRPCTQLVRYELDESSEIFLSNPTVMMKFLMDEQGPGTATHVGGSLALDEAGFLYLATGDGHPNEDAENSSAQDNSSPLGKLFRIDLATLEPTLVAKGLRNPFTMIATDSGLLLGDVGSFIFEEINFFSWNDADLVNFGWPLEEGPGQLFRSPFQGWPHCSEAYEKLQHEDPYREPTDEGGKALTVKKHAGIIHECKDQVITVMGSVGDRVFYSNPYYGFVRSFQWEEGQISDDRHMTHLPGMTNLVEGLDGSIYGVSLFSSNTVLKLVPNDQP